VLVVILIRFLRSCPYEEITFGHITTDIIRLNFLGCHRADVLTRIVNFSHVNLVPLLLTISQKVMWACVSATVDSTADRVDILSAPTLLESLWTRVHSVWDSHGVRLKGIHVAGFVHVPYRR
jgi:hypothetical protein